MTLTRHEPGSLRELWSISLPLMVSALSVMTMVFVDRLMVAHYSTVALNAVVNASTFGWAFVFAWMVLASISEVFVAQYNGAGAKEKIGESVWQMIWLSLLSFLFFIPFAYYGECLFYGNEIEYKLAQDYFKWMMFFGPSFPLYSALCGFFVGRGKTTLITVLAILANGINALLNYILIFGIEGWIPSYGPRGSVIATSGSTIFQALVLFIVFLSEKNRQEFGSGFFGFKPLAFWRSIKVGFPNAMFVGIEILGFAAYYAMMTLMGEKYITIAGICQSVIILLYFFADGISKAGTTVAGNLIGAQKQTLIPQVFFAGVKMHVIFFFIMLGAFYLFSDDLLRAFLPNASPELYKNYYNALAIGLFCMIFYMFFEGVRLLLTGLLTAAGDTLFLLYAGSLSVWIFLVLPIYLIVVLGQTPVEVSSLLCVVYSFVACAIYFWRFQSGKWQHIKILGS